MGRAKGDFFSGGIGPVVFYVMNGKQYARSRPVRTKKPNARMVERNNLFAEITRPSSRMLKNIKETLVYRVGFNDYNRLRGWMYIAYCANHDKVNWPVTVDNNICQLNPEADLRHFITANITVNSKGSEGILASFPAFNPLSVIRAPLKTTKVTIKVIVSSATQVPPTTHIIDDSYSFDYRDVVVPAKEFVLIPDGMQNGDICIVTVAIEYEKSGTIYKTDPKWLPAAAIAMGGIKN